MNPEATYLDNEHYEFWQENGILYLKLKPGTELTLDIARQMVADRKKFTNNQPVLLFADLTYLVNAELPARDFLSGKEGTESIRAGAFLVNTMQNKFAAKVFVEHDQPENVPTKLFTSRKEAIEWLEGF